MKRPTWEEIEAHGFGLLDVWLDSEPEPAPQAPTPRELEEDTGKEWVGVGTRREWRHERREWRTVVAVVREEKRRTYAIRTWHYFPCGRRIAPKPRCE